MDRQRHDGPLPAWQMSTPAIKTELLAALKVVRPNKGWTKRAKLGDIAIYAVDNLDHESKDPKRFARSN